MEFLSGKSRWCSYLRLLAGRREGKLMIFFGQTRPIPKDWTIDLPPSSLSPSIGLFLWHLFRFFLLLLFSSSLGRLLRHIARACPAPVQHQLHLTLKASWNCSPGGSSSSLGGTSAGHPALFYTIPLFSSLFFFNRILVFRSATHTRYTFRSCALASAHHLSIRAPPSPTIIYTGGKS